MILAIFFLAFFALAQAQYGVPQYNQPQYNQPQYNVPQLIDNYVCSIEAGYSLFGKRHHRSHRPIRNFCVDATKPDSCQRCCEMAALIGGTTVNQSDIFGFHVVLKREPLCICCAPSSSTPSTYNQAPPAAADPTNAPPTNYY